MKWLAKRFKYTRELEKALREEKQCAAALELIVKMMEGNRSADNG